MAKRKSIIDQVDEYCAKASPDAVDLLLQIVKRHVKKPVKTETKPRKKQEPQAGTEVGDGR